MKWIKVSQQLPEIGKKVVFLTDKGTEIVGSLKNHNCGSCNYTCPGENEELYFSSNECCCISEVMRNIADIEYWMELPEIPNEVD